MHAVATAKLCRHHGCSTAWCHFLWTYRDPLLQSWGCSNVWLLTGTFAFICILECTHTHTFLSDVQRFVTRLSWDALPSSHSQPVAATLKGRLWICFCMPASADLQVCSGWLDVDVWIEVLCSCVAFHGCEFSQLWYKKYKNKKNPHTFHAAAIEHGKTARPVVGPWCIWSLVQE